MKPLINTTFYYWYLLFLSGEFLISLFNLAGLLDCTNEIQNIIDNILMEVRLDMKVENDVDIIENFLTTFKPQIGYFNISLPNEISDEKLKKLLNSLSELNTMVNVFLFCFKAPIVWEFHFYTDFIFSISILVRNLFTVFYFTKKQL